MLHITPNMNMLMKIECTIYQAKNYPIKYSRTKVIQDIEKNSHE